MSDPEFGLTDYDILKETFDNIGVEYKESPCYKPTSVLSPDKPKEPIGYTIDIDLANGDAEVSYGFDTDGEFVKTSLWTAW